MPFLTSTAFAIGSLGFKGAQCCTAPCPRLPVTRVSIKMVINSETSVAIRQGCRAPVTSGALPQYPCDVTYAAGGTVEETWGKKCRTFLWERSVPAGSYVSIVVSGKCTSMDCGSSASVRNQLVHFIVDDTNITDFLQSTLRSTTSSNGCVTFTCCADAGMAGVCCDPATFATASLQNLPFGMQIAVGPLGERSFP